MKIMIFLLFIVTALSAATIPYLTGVGAEKQFTTLQQTQKTATIINENYQRGWFSSEIDSTYELPLKGIPNAQIQLQHTIEHGLLPVRATLIHSTVKLGEHLQQKWGTLPNLAIKTAIHADGSSHSTVNLPALTVSQATQNIYMEKVQGELSFDRQLNWQALTQHYQAEVMTKAGKGHFFIPTLRIEQAGIVWELTGVTLDFDLHPEQVFWLQKMDISVTKLTAALKGQSPLLAIDKLAWQQTHETIGDQLTISMASQMKKVHWLTDEYQPVLLHASIKKLDVPSLQQLQAATLSSYQTQAVQQPLIALGSFLPPLMGLIKHQPSFTIDEFIIGEAPEQLHGTLAVNFPSASPVFLFDPLSLVRQVSAEVQWSSHATLLNRLLSSVQTPEMTQQAIQQWLKKGWVAQQKQQHYQSHIELKNGVLYSNKQAQLQL